MKQIFLLFCVLFSAANVFAQAGTFDPDFASMNEGNSDGFYISEDFNASVEFTDAIIHDETSFIALILNNDCIQLTNFTFDGNPVESFDNNPDDEHYGTKVFCLDAIEFDFLQPVSLINNGSDGYIALCAADNTVGMIRFDSDGIADRSLGAGGYITIAENVNSVDYITDYFIHEENLYLSYRYLNQDIFFGNAILKCDLMGNINENFGTNGIYDFGLIQDVDTEGISMSLNTQFNSIISVQNITSYDETEEIIKDSLAIVALTIDGQINDQIGDNGIIASLGNVVDNIEFTFNDAMQKDNDIYVEGYDYYIDSDMANTFVYKYNLASGGLDASFGDEGKMYIKNSDFNNLEAFLIKEINGDIYCSGIDFGFDNSRGYFISRIDPVTGVLDSVFEYAGISRGYYSNDFLETK